MSIIEGPESLELVKSVLRGLPVNSSIRHYDATPEDYEQITDEDLKCEFVDGELIMHSPASLEHEDLAAFAIPLLRLHVGDHALGRVFGSNAVMQLGERRFSPDVSVLKNEHADRVNTKTKRVVGPMDLVVEIISKSTRAYDFGTKLPAYREGHVPEIWFLDAERRQFEVHARRGESYESAVLATGEWSSLVLPGLTVNVDWFWQDPLPPISACR